MQPQFVSLALAFIVAFVEGKKVCYPPYGCFSNEPPFKRPFVRLPETPQVVGTKFMLYTRLQSAYPDIISDADISSIRTSTFDGKKTTFVVVHGYLEKASVFYMRLMIERLLKKEDANVIVVHWEQGARFPYHQAVGNSRLVGAQLEALLELLKNQFELDYGRVHIIGSGLGAHVAGYAGRNIKRKNEKLARISALDAAAPLFENEHVDVRLDRTDASFVDAIHTDSKTFIVSGYGMKNPFGHLDFYPNGGYEQKHCRKRDDGAVSFFTCSHYRAVHYFIESLDARCPFNAYPCSSYKEFKRTTCTVCPAAGCPMMGYNSQEHIGKLNGSFYLRTNGESPFCVFHYKITFYTANGFFTDLTAGAAWIKITGDNGVSESIPLEYRYIASGSVENFLAVTTKDLGKLQRIKVWHKAVADKWKLHKVEVVKFGSTKKFVGCFNRWLNTQDNEVSLNEYNGRYLC